MIDVYRNLPESLKDMAERLNFPESERNLSPEKSIFRTLSAPVTLQWELTPWCNENCIHCYNFWRVGGNNNPFISPNMEVYKASSQEIVNNKIFQVTVTGGEPLAVFRQSYPFLEYLVENKISLSLNSNLTMLNKEKAKLLKKLSSCSILTSLLSGNPELNNDLTGRPNTHKDVTRGINIALNEGLYVEVNMVVTKANLSDIFSTAEYVKNLGVTAFSATKAAAPVNSKDFSEYALSQRDFQLMISELNKIKNELGLEVDSLEFYPPCAFDTQESRDLCANHICTAGKTTCTIGFDGQIRPCSHAVQTYGSILDEGGLSQAWISLQPWRTDTFIPTGCNNCTLKNTCGGGCRSEAYAVSGSLKAPDPYCNFLRLPLFIKEQKNTK